MPNSAAASAQDILGVEFVCICITFALEGCIVLLAYAYFGTHDRESKDGKWLKALVATLLGLSIVMTLLNSGESLLSRPSIWLRSRQSRNIDS
jgi:hypothetical protein